MSAKKILEIFLPYLANKVFIRLSVVFSIAILISVYLWTEPSRKLKKALIGDWNVGTVYIDGIDQTGLIMQGYFSFNDRSPFIPNLRGDPVLNYNSTWNINGRKLILERTGSTLAQTYDLCFLFGGQSMILELESDHLLLYLHKGLIPTELDRKRNMEIYQKFACDTSNDEPPSIISQQMGILE